MQDLKVRFFTSIIIVIILGGLVYFSNLLPVGISLTCVYMVVLILALWEFYHMAMQQGIHIQIGVSFIGAIAYVAATFVSFFIPCWSTVPTLVLGLILFFLLLQHFFSARDPIRSVSVSFFGILYVIVPLTFLLKINFSTSMVGISGQWWAMFVVLVTKGGDVGAYFFGKTIGKHYLAPKISPKKTLEGLFGGLLFSLIISFAIIYLSPRALQLLSLPWLYALIFGSALAIIGLVGDLAESLLKRDAGVKDSNKLQGIGGMLDMMDSLIFTGPAFFLFLTFWNLI